MEIEFRDVFFAQLPLKPASTGKKRNKIYSEEVRFVEGVDRFPIKSVVSC